MNREGNFARERGSISSRITFLTLTLPVATFVAFLGQPLEAAQAQVKRFLGSLKTADIDFQYAERGLNSVSGVSFEDEVNHYQPFLNRLVLMPTMSDGQNAIHEASQLSAIDAGIVFHEAFHAYKANFIDKRSELSALKGWLESRAKELFPDLPKNKRETALEEAYASFIGNMVTAKLNLAPILLKTKAQDCERRIVLVDRLWNARWSDEIKGYYYRDGVGEYWAIRAKAMWILTTQGRRAYLEYMDSQREIFTEASLTETDRAWISMNILESRLTSDFRTSLSKEIQSSACAQ